MSWTNKLYIHIFILVIYIWIYVYLNQAEDDLSDFSLWISLPEVKSIDYYYFFFTCKYIIKLIFKVLFSRLPGRCLPLLKKINFFAREDEKLRGTERGTINYFQSYFTNKNGIKTIIIEKINLKIIIFLTKVFF